VLARPRLLRALGGAWKLASLVSPAGWGKTTALAQWCAGRDTLWVTATGAERDPAHLLGSLLAAGSRLSPPFGTRTLARHAARREFERDGGLLTATFLHELAERAGAIHVVIDDAHELAGARSALGWLAGVVERSPATVRFAFAARGESLWPEGRFASLGERHLSRAELAFDAREAARLLAREGVPARERAAIAERQQGWAAGLRAAARAGEAGDVAWSTLVGRELGVLAPEERRDLLLASLLDDLESGVLHTLLGPARARSLLHTLRRRALFVEEAGAQARFHPLFHDVLRDLAARELTPAARQRALRRAAVAYAERAMPARALAALAASGAGREAVAGFERAWAANEHDGALAALAHGWLAAGEPRSAAASPAVRQSAARADADAGRFTEATTGAAAAAEAWLARGRLLAAARASALSFTLALQTGRLREGLRDGERLHARLAGRNPAAAAVVLAWLGALRLHAGDPAAARRDLDRALATLPERLGVERAEAEMHRATVEFTAGRWTDYLSRTRRALEQFRRFGYWGRAHALLVNMAEAYIYLGEEAVARRHLDDAAALSARSGLHARGVLVEIGRARAFSEEGRMADAARAFRAARREAAHASTRLFDAMLDTWEGVWRRRRGEPRQAIGLLTRAAAAFDALESPAWRNVARIELALAKGLDGEPRAALAELASCARTSHRLGDRKEEARVRLFEARVRQAAGEEFRVALARALRLLDRENYRVLLRKERDVAGPLLAADGARGTRLRLEDAAPRRTSDAPHVTVRLLGGFAVERGGERVQPARTAARQLIALLALHHGRPQRREALIEALWPGLPPDGGRNRFDVALHDARRALDPDAGPRGPFETLRSEGGLVWLDEGVDRDLQRFETLAGQADREGTDAARARALALHAGPLLPEWPDASWADDARLRVASLADGLLLGRARAAFEGRAPERALQYVDALLATDPLNEEALGWRLRALVALGRRSLAARAAREHAVRCRRELDSPPGPELVALARELGLDGPRESS
jgi:ATP/maltotriose-dependent transcriptional regulator MalT/DNA-binding SARP family transcriptional activator